MFVFLFREMSELLTSPVVSPECHSAWANTDPGPVLESTSYTKKHKANETSTHWYVGGKDWVIPSIPKHTFEFVLYFPAFEEMVQNRRKRKMLGIRKKK